MQTLFYNLGISLLFTHELDAMLREEWNLLIGLKSLPQEQAVWWFIYLHVPIFSAVLYFGNSTNKEVKNLFRLGVCGFLPIHGALHFALSGRENYHFHHPLSELLIYGAAMFGILYLANTLRMRNSD